METGRAWFGWIVPGSAALHVLAVALLPNASRAPIVSRPVVIEMIDPPAPEPPPAPPPPRDEPAEESAAAPTPARAAVTPARARGAPASTNERPAEDSPVDFSGIAMSNDGPGAPIAAAGPAAGPVAAAATSARAAPSAPRLVLAKDLSRPPRAPGLDAALEQHYPAQARRSGISGKAVLRVKILADGRVGAVQRIEEAAKGFAEACEKTVRSARWEPPIDREGAPVATEITYTCRFEIRG